MQDQLKKFWKKKSNIIFWNKKPNKIFSSQKNYFFKWFEDGKLNVFSNCVIENINNGLADKVAIVTVNKDKKIEKFTYKELENFVNNFSHLLIKKLGNKNLSKKKILIHTSAGLNSAVSMLACANLGIEFSVVFEELEFQALKSRIKLFKPNLILTNLSKKEYKNKFKKKLFDSKKIFFLLELDYKKKNKKKYIVNSFYSNKKLFTLFTSGSTGMPKGIVHSTGGYLVYSKLTCKNQFGMNEDSVVLAASDAGWINGHTYSLFGPLSFGATSILLQSPILLLDFEILKKIILNYKVTILYLPVTIIRLMKSLFKSKKIYSKNLITLGSMGEPLAKTIGQWYSNFFNLKKKAIINTYFQTETGGIICSPKFTQRSKTVPHGSVGNALFKEIKISQLFNNKKKEFKILSLWPGCMINVLNGLNEWKKYWTKEKKFRMFDLATIKNNNIYIHGRVDDVINIRGHRIGSEEIESTVLKLNQVKECCVVMQPDNLEGSVINLFISASKFDLNKNIELLIQQNFGTFAIPRRIIYVSELPKTRSGKILRRLLRNLLLYKSKKNLGDLTTMINPRIIDEILKKI